MGKTTFQILLLSAFISLKWSVLLTKVDIKLYLQDVKPHRKCFLVSFNFSIILTCSYTDEKTSIPYDIYINE